VRRDDAVHVEHRVCESERAAKNTRLGFRVCERTEEAVGAYPAIRLFERNGMLHTLDNRRLLVFSEAGMQVPFRMATEAEIAKEFTGKFTTTAAQGWGQFTTVRP
jgi:hypothetical protein